MKSVFLEYWYKRAISRLIVKDFWQGFIYCFKGYLMFLAVIIPLQRFFIYAPSSRMIIHAGDISALEESYPTADGLELTAWYVAAAKNFPTIVMFHGNAGNISHRGGKMSYFISQGYGFLLAEYRGYGGNRGRPSEGLLYSDARSVLRWLQEEKGVRLDDIVVYGESIGTGIAVQMALENPKLHALVLEAPIKNIPDVAVSKMPWLWPVGFMVLDRYENDLKIPHIRMPLLIVHGTKDEIVPLEHGKFIYEKASSDKKVLEIVKDGRHNNLDQYGLLQRIDNFLSGFKLNE